MFKVPYLLNTKNASKVKWKPKLANCFMHESQELSANIL